MKQKILLLLCISMLSTSAFAQDKTHSWNPAENANTTYKWTEAANWFLHDGAEGYPNDIESANAEIGNGDYPAVGEVIVDAEVSVFNLKVGNGGEEEAVLRITKGGKLTTGKWWSGIGWTSPGKLIVENGGEMTFGEHFWIGWKVEATAIIEGTVNVTAMYGGAGFSNSEDGISNTFVKNGGVLNLSQLNPEKSFANGSFIDIAGGTLNFKTNADGAEEAMGVLQTFIDDESIVSYEGNGELTLTLVGDTNIVVTAASVVYHVDLNEVTDKKDGGKVWVMLGDGSDYEPMTDDNGDGIYVASITADRAVDLTYYFEYENASGDRVSEDMTGKDCASGNKRAIAAVPENEVLVLPAYLYNACEEKPVSAKDLNLTDVNSVSVYPNPSDFSNLNFQISLRNSLDEISISIYDLQGRLLEQKVSRNNNAGESTVRISNLTHLDSGIYIYKINSSNGIIELGKISKY